MIIRPWNSKSIPGKEETITESPSVFETGLPAPDDSTAPLPTPESTVSTEEPDETEDSGLEVTEEFTVEVGDGEDVGGF